MKIFMDCNILLKYDGDNGVLSIHDLTPEWKTKVAMTRWELLVMGFRCICAALKPCKIK